MHVDDGYRCKKCGRLYHKSKSRLPIYCNGCGTELVKERYSYNLTTDMFGKVVETTATNAFGGYDYVKIVLAENVEEVKLKRSWLFFWELFQEE